MTAATKTAQTSESGFTADERAAMKARAAELRASGRGGQKKADEAQALLDAIAKMPSDDRELAERVHGLVMSAAPDLDHKTWYGMPAYARDGKVVLFFKAASKFGARYATLGFSDEAALDDGNLWPTEYAVAQLAEKDAKKIETLIRNAAG